MKVMLATVEAASGIFTVLFLLVGIGLVILQICLIVAVFRTSKATQDAAWYLEKALRELKYIGDQLTPPR